MRARCLPALLLLGLLLGLGGGCSCGPLQVRNVAKSDIGLVTEAHRRQMTACLQTLMLKLYARNPSELAKAPGLTVQERVGQVFFSGPLEFVELDHRQGVPAMLLAFDEDYPGDRVFALMAGLEGMIRLSYGNREEFYLFDTLKAQDLYNSARNLEILAWRLANRCRADGRPWLLTNSLPGEETNLSFERLFGKMIALQDMMAEIAAGGTDRTINRVVLQVASAVFLPVGL